MAARASSSSSNSSNANSRRDNSAASGSSSSSSGGDVSAGDEIADISRLKSTTTNADSCMWYANSECSKPRSCFDCLNVAIPSGECAIDPRGQCVTKAEYDSFVKARQYYYPNYKYYPSSNYTYCSALDATCQNCKQKWIQDYYAIGNTPAIGFCRGEGGCVCVAYCELPGWSDTVIGNQCSDSGSSKNHTTKILSGIGVGVGLCILFIVAAFSVRYIVRRLDYNRNARNREHATREREPTGPQLNLSGWKSMREKLIESERHHLSGHRARVTRTITDAGVSVPVLEAEVEDGEGFRPDSPSDLERQHADIR